MNEAHDGQKRVLAGFLSFAMLSFERMDGYFLPLVLIDRFCSLHHDVCAPVAKIEVGNTDLDDFILPGVSLSSIPLFNVNDSERPRLKLVLQIMNDNNTTIYQHIMITTRY